MSDQNQTYTETQMPRIERNQNIIDMRAQGIGFARIGEKWGITQRRAQAVVNQYAPHLIQQRIGATPTICPECGRSWICRIPTPHHCPSCKYDFHKNN